MASLWKVTELYIFRARRLAVQYLAIRRVRRGIAMLVVLLFGAIIYSQTQYQKSTVSAVGCKSKIAQVAITSPEKRQSYLDPMGMNYKQLENDFFYYVTTVTHSCMNQVHIGPADDGGWDVCLESRFDITEPCLIYSFGIGHDFRFEKGIEKMLKCEVHAFDPSMEMKSHQYSDKGFFYDIGIDSADAYANRGRWKLRRLSTIMAQLGHTGQTLDFVKMDIEFSEWPALYDLVTSGLIKSIRQMALEIHTPEMDIHDKPHHVCTWSTLDTLAFMMRTLIELKNAGFHIFHTRTNHRTRFRSALTHTERYCCYDIHLVNLRHPQSSYQ